MRTLAIEIKEPSREPIRVSDHAVLRYLERGVGINVEMVRSHIAALCAAPAAFGAVAVRSERLRFEITNNTVLTVRYDAQSPGAAARDRAQHKIRRRSEDMG